MSKATKHTTPDPGSEAFEMIELAIEDFSLLTRAFRVIQDVCEEANNPQIKLDRDLPKKVIN